MAPKLVDPKTVSHAQALVATTEAVRGICTMANAAETAAELDNLDIIAHGALRALDERGIPLEVADEAIRPAVEALEMRAGALGLRWSSSLHQADWTQPARSTH